MGSAQESSRKPSESPFSDNEFERLAQSLHHDSGTHVNVPFVIAAGIVVALIALSFVYSWPLWASIGLIVALGVLSAVSMYKRPPVAPLELTANERTRVERVLKDHGVRPAIALVRGLYPEESPASANRTVKIILERIVAAEKGER